MVQAADKVTALIADLERSDKQIIRKAVDTLISLAVNNPQLETTLGQLLSDPTRKNRWPIAYILASLPCPDRRPITILIETLGDRDSDIRWAVALLLVRLAKKDQQIVPRLIETVAHGTATQRRMAVYCVRDLGLVDQTTSRALVSALRDADPMVRVAAVTSLAHRSDLDSESRALLLDLFLKDADNRVRNASAITLAQLGSPSEEFIAALEKVSQSNDVGMRKAANAALDVLKIKRSAPFGS